MTTDTSGPAFPTTEPERVNEYGDLRKAVYYHGCTKRELFAAMAMQGMVAHLHINTPYGAVAEWSVAQADALLAELAKP